MDYQKERSRRKVSKEFQHVVIWLRTITVKWTDTVRNDEVLMRTVEGRKLLKVIRKRQTSLLVHKLYRNYQQLRVIEGEVEGKRGWGR